MNIFKLVLFVIASLCSMSQAKKTLMKTKLMSGGNRKYREYCTNGNQCSYPFGCFNNQCLLKYCGFCESKGMCCFIR